MFRYCKNPHNYMFLVLCDVLFSASSPWAPTGPQQTWRWTNRSSQLCVNTAGNTQRFDMCLSKKWIIPAAAVGPAGCFLSESEAPLSGQTEPQSPTRLQVYSHTKLGTDFRITETPHSYFHQHTQIFVIFAVRNKHNTGRQVHYVYSSPNILLEHDSSSRVTETKQKWTSKTICLENVHDVCYN